MDRQQADLRQRLSGRGVELRREGDDLRLIMPGDLAFVTGESRVAFSFRRILDDVANVLNTYDQTIIEIVGHTDTLGAAQFNETLSHERAKGVFDHLSERGVLPVRMLVIGYGEYRPFVPTGDEVSEAKNRRVELRISPLI